jgi:hypothetical protein
VRQLGGDRPGRWPEPNSAGKYYYNSNSSGAKGAYLTSQIYGFGIPAASDGQLTSSSGSLLYYAEVSQPGF